MANNYIETIKSDAILSSTISIINKNFLALKEAIGTGNTTLANYDKQIGKNIDDFKTYVNNALESFSEIINQYCEQIKTIESTIEENNTLISSSITTLVEKTEYIETAITTVTSQINDDENSIVSQLELITEKTEEYELAIARLKSEITNADGSSLKSQLELLTSQTQELQQSVATLKSEIDGDGDGNAEISAKLQLLTQRTDALETSISTLNSQINDGESSIKSQLKLLAEKDTVTKDEMAAAILKAQLGGDGDTSGIESTLDLLVDRIGKVESAQGTLSSSIDGVKASISTCVTKDENGYIESGVKIYADKVDLEGKKMTFTGDQININTDNFKVNGNGNVKITGEINATSGTFNGSVNATEFNVMDALNNNALTFKIWDSDDNSTYSTSSSISVGTPVFIAKTYNSDGSIKKMYVTNMMELSTKSGIGGSVFLSGAYKMYNNISYKATTLCSNTTSYSWSVVKCDDGVYRDTSTDGSKSEGKYIIKKSTSFFVRVSFNGYTYYIIDVTGFNLIEYTFKDGALQGKKYYYCVPYISASTNNNAYYDGSTYHNTYSVHTNSTYYGFVKTIDTTKYPFIYVGNSYVDSSFTWTPGGYSKLPTDVDESWSNRGGNYDIPNIVTDYTTETSSSSGITNPVYFSEEYSCFTNINI